MAGFVTPAPTEIDTRTATLIVAASDSLHPTTANYICDGVADDVEIQAAVDALPATGGCVVLLDGTYNLTAQIARAINDVEIRGNGHATELNLDGVTPIFTAGIQDGWIFSQFSVDAGGVTIATATQSAIRSVWIAGVRTDDPAGVTPVTFVVAASDSLNPGRADYQCDGVADEAEINAALNALPAQGGRVVLLEGQYVLATPIIIPDDDIILEGQGWNVLINGNNLPNNDNGVELTGRSNCYLRDFAIRTNAGGGQTCHCIFAEDGCHDLRIENIYVQDSDSDGIHIEGSSTSRVKILNCFIEGADDHGINITPDALDITQYFQIFKNHIFSAGIDGIHLANCAGHQYMIIEGNHIGSCVGDGIGATYLFESTVANNYIRGCTADGIELTADCDNNLIDNNYCNSCGGVGINIVAATCDDNRVKNNKLIGNTGGAITDAGTNTQLPYIFIPVPNPSTNIGEHPAEQLTDGLEVTSRLEVLIPLEFQELVSAGIILVPGGTGNLRRRVATDWGEVGSGETYNNDSGAIAAGQVAVVLNHTEILDITAAFTGVAPIAGGDTVGVNFTREGNNALDTVNAICYLIGLRLRYV